jgi:hypothetical protein
LLGGGLARSCAETGDRDDDEANENEKAQRQAENELDFLVVCPKGEKHLERDNEGQHWKQQALPEGGGYTALLHEGESEKHGEAEKANYEKGGRSHAVEPSA